MRRGTGIAVVRVGGMGKIEMVFPIMKVCTKELSVKGSFRCGSGDYGLVSTWRRVGG